MRSKGWYKRPGVTVLEGRWQDHIESEEILGAGGFDVVYTDTFSEDYQGKLRSDIANNSVDEHPLDCLELKNLFEHLPDLLDGPEATFSFFNGLGATSMSFRHSSSLGNQLTPESPLRRNVLRCLHAARRIASLKYRHERELE